MIDFERGLYVRVKELPNGPQPLPLAHGFSESVAYRVLGIYNPSESGECWLIMSNDRDEMWYISQRHFRTWKLLEFETAFTMPISAIRIPAASMALESRFND